MFSRTDLHIHSRYSDRSAEWILRQFQFPDSYTQPVEIYRLLKERGMDFITITDHNRIEGCLEIGDKPGTFISEEVSTYFPEDRCRVHLLVWGITEEQHREMQALRENIYDLQKYLAAGGLAHAVAHPLYKVDERFTAGHLERLFLLFKCFEGINGLRDSLLSDTLRFIVSKLTPEKIAGFSERHRMEPTHAEPWKKFLTAGSDDHGGIFAGSAYTAADGCGSAAKFLAKVREGRCEIHGEGGTSLAFSHGLYNTIYSFLGDKVFKGKNASYGLVAKVFSRFMEGKDPTEFSLPEKIGFVAQGIMSGKVFELAKPANASLWKQFATYFAENDVKTLLARQTAGVAEPERRAFLIANLFANQLAFRFFTRFIKELSSGNMIESIQDVSTLVPILLTLSPYFYSFHSQAPSRRWLRELCLEVSGEIPPALRNRKRAWFTDTLEDVNGVATTIKKMTATAVAAGEDLVVVTSRTSITITGIPIKNFPPIGEFEMPEYELQKLSFPPILEMLDYIKREQFTELIISTPGPVGITALLAAKIFGLRVSGIYHTDFPQYVRILTDDSYLETLMWNYMHWFYSQLDQVFVNSEEYRRSWVARGIDPAKIPPVPPRDRPGAVHPATARARLLEGARDRAGRDGAALRGPHLEGKGPGCSRGRIPQIEGGRPAGGAGAGGGGAVFQGAEGIAPGRHLHRLPGGRGARESLCLGGCLPLPEHHGHFWQRGAGGARLGPAGRRLRPGRPEGVDRLREDRVHHEEPRRGGFHQRRPSPGEGRAAARVDGLEHAARGAGTRLGGRIR